MSKINYREEVDKVDSPHSCTLPSILQQCSTDSTLVTFQLPLPPVICCDINEEIDYQRDL